MATLRKRVQWECRECPVNKKTKQNRRFWTIEKNGGAGRQCPRCHSANVRKLETRWQALVRVQGSKARVATFNSKAQAETWAARTQDLVKSGEALSVEAGKRKVGELIAEYVERVLPARKLRTEERIRQQLEWWAEEIGAYGIAEVNYTLLMKSLHRLEDETSGSTVNRYKAVAGPFFDWCVKSRLIRDNPMRAIEHWKEPEGRTRFLSADELDKLITACKAETDRPDLLTQFVLACYTGMRKGEVCNLKWRDVNLAERYLILPRTKNGDPRRVSLNPVALEALTTWRALTVRSISNDAVFPNGFADWQWRRAVKQSGVTNFRFHDARHTYASYLAMSGASLMDIAAILGHKTLDMTRRYAHLMPSYLDRVTDRMAEALPLPRS